MNDAISNPEEDLKHAYALLAHMSPEQLLLATHAMEDMLEGAVYVSWNSPVEDELIDSEEKEAAAQGRQDLAKGRTSTFEEILTDHGLTADEHGMITISPEAERTAA